MRFGCTRFQRGTVGTLLILAAMFARAGDARADYPIQKVIMQCDAPQNKLLLRFGTLDAEDLPPDISVTLSDFNYGVKKVPTDLPGSWNDIAYTIAGHCKLRNGQTVTVSVEYGPSSSHDPVPDAYLSMEIDSHSVYSGRMFNEEAPQQDNPHDLSAIEYDGKTLLECADTNNAQPITVASSCHDESARLRPGHLHLPPAELRELQRVALKHKLESSLSSFCRMVHTLPHGTQGDHLFPDALYVPEDGKPQGIRNNDNLVGVATITMVDIYNNGLPVAIIDVEDSSAYFDGNFLVLFPAQDAKLQAFIADLKNGFDIFAEDAAAVVYRKYNAKLVNIIPKYIIARGNLSPRYRNYSLLRIKSINYIFSANSDPMSVPSGVLSRLTADHSVKTVCLMP